MIAGRGVAELERAVQDAAVRLPQIEARVGYVTEAEKASLLSEAALLVLPYTAFASQSAVLHDAYAHGVPVVVTDVGALGATVRAEGTGWVVPPGDDAALSAAITTALGDPVALAARSAAARAVGAERTPAAVAERLRAIYRGVAG